MKLKVQKGLSHPASTVEVAFLHSLTKYGSRVALSPVSPIFLGHACMETGDEATQQGYGHMYSMCVCHINNPLPVMFIMDMGIQSRLYTHINTNTSSLAKKGMSLFHFEREGVKREATRFCMLHTYPLPSTPPRAWIKSCLWSIPPYFQLGGERGRSPHPQIVMCYFWDYAHCVVPE